MQQHPPENSSSSDDDPIRAEASPVYRCPDCGEVVEPPPGPVNVLLCPACGSQFFAETNPEVADASDGDEAEKVDDDRDRDAEFNAMRIHQVKVLRRGLYRTRSYWIVLLVTLIVIAGQLVWMSVARALALGWGLRSTGYVLAAVACVIGCPMVLGHVATINRELRETLQGEPDVKPDFSTLSDGSQQWQNLQDMGG